MKEITGKNEGMATRAALAGGGMGLGLFAIYGVINASFIGGIMGLNLAGAIMGFPVESALLSKVLVAFGMLSGVLAAGLIFIAVGSTAGWLAGKLIDITLKAAHHRGNATHSMRH
jgi:hypothetical protein